MEWHLVTIIMLFILIGLFLLRVPVAFALGLAGATGICLFLKPAAISVVGNIAWEVSTNFVLLCLPLFLLMGEIMFRMKLGEGLFAFLHKLFGSIPAGLAMASVIASAFMGAITGVALAVIAIVGTMAYPEMKKRGYSERLSTGMLASSSGLGILIPPSLPMILYGLITGDSIGRLFMAGIVPGIMIMIFYCVYCVIASGLGIEEAPAAGTVSTREKVAAFRKVWPSILLILVVLGGIYSGIMTPTEAAAVGCAGALFIALLIGTLTWENIRLSFMDATRASCAILMIVIGARVFSYLVSVVGIPQHLATWLVSLHAPPPFVMFIIMAILVVLGMLMDVTPIILITTPIFFPLLKVMGWDSVWFCTVVIMSMMMAVVTPPVGLCLFVTGDISGVPLQTITRGAMPFLAIIVLSIIIVYIFPEIALWLPNHMMGSR
ncbi:MAG TPA: TRAP transporter large permease subunit [Syntrophales bacterium]|nr:TRAP transporter large permease subunit [Syntrophales bacterium]